MDFLEPFSTKQINFIKFIKNFIKKRNFTYLFINNNNYYLFREGFSYLKIGNYSSIYF